MDAIPSHRLTEPASRGSKLDPKSPEFYDACKALIGRSSARRLPGAAGRLEDATDEAQIAALRDVWLRQAEDRAELEALLAELTELTTLYEDTATALKEASDEVSQTRARLIDAERTISDRDLALERVRQELAEREQQVAGQNRLIEDLQQYVLHVEQARAADASAILESLDRYKN